MKKNVGILDKSIRIFVAVIIGVLFFSKIITGVLAIALIIVAAILLLTSLIGSCPIYSLLGLNTCPIKNHKNL